MAVDGVKMVVTPSDLTRQVTIGSVRVHRHGSGIYRGRYLALRSTAGRRAILATGKPDSLRVKLASMGIVLYQDGKQWKVC